VAWATHDAMIHSVRVRSSRIEPPSAFTGQDVVQGFRDYDSKCAMCHGAPGVPRQTWVAGMTPTPPFLVDSARQWTPAQLDLIVGDGVKMTAMPGWRTSLPDDRIWRIVAFLEALPYISPGQYAQMRAAYAPPPNRQTEIAGR